MSSKLACIRLLFFVSSFVVTVILGAEIFPEFVKPCVLEVSCNGAVEASILPVLISSKYASSDALFAEIIVPEFVIFPVLDNISRPEEKMPPELIKFSSKVIKALFCMCNAPVLLFSNLFPLKLEVVAFIIPEFANLPDSDCTNKFSVFITPELVKFCDKYNKDSFCT